MAKGNAIVMYLEQARIHGEPIGVTHSEVLFTKPNGYTVQPHNRVVSKADNKTMGESFLNELIYVLGAEDGEERKLPYDREVLVYTSDEINSDNYRTYINAVNTGINYPVHNFKLCQKLRRLCDERGYHLFFSNNSLLGSTIRNDAIAASYNISEEEYLQQVGAESEDALLDTYNDQIKNSVTSLLIFQAIAEEQHIKVTDADVNAYFGNDELSVKQAKSYYGEEFLNQSVLFDKVYTWLVDHASIV